MPKINLKKEKQTAFEKFWLDFCPFSSKGIVHPKNENSATIYSPLISFQACMIFFFLWNINEDILWNVLMDSGCQ